MLIVMECEFKRGFSILWKLICKLVILLFFLVR